MQTLGAMLWRRTSGLGKDERTARACSASLSMNLSLGESLALVRAAEQAHLNSGRHSAELAARRLQEWKDGQANHAETLRKVMPELADYDLTPIPTPGPTFCFECSPPAPNDVTAAASWATAHGHSTRLGVAAVDHWQHQHQLLKEADCEQFADDDIEKESKCFKAGVCLCRGQGVGLKRATDKLLACVRAAFRAKTHPRPL